MEKIIYSDGEIERKNSYTELFYTNLDIRPSCGLCDFSSINRSGDFSIGDYWGVQKVFPEFHDDNGVSLLFLNSDRAVQIFEQIKADVEYVETDEEHAALQPNLKGHSYIPKCRKWFWKDYKRYGLEYAIRHWSPAGGILFRIKRKLMKILNIW